MRAPRVSWVALAGVTALLLPREAHAYLDPGTGSMLLSALLSVLVTAGFALQNYGYRLLAFFRRSRADAPPNQSERKRNAQEGDDERGMGGAAPAPRPGAHGTP